MKSQRKTARVRRRSMMTHNKTVGYGWVGRWNDKNRSIGWAVPEFLDSGGKNYCFRMVERHSSSEPIEVTFCRITVEVVRDRRGREIKAKVVPRKGLTRGR